MSSGTEAARMRINAMISSSANKGLLQDDIVTMRDGRFVIPVKQENRSRFPAGSRWNWNWCATAKAAP